MIATTRPSPTHTSLLRQTLLTDVAAIVAASTVALVAAGPIEATTGIPAALLVPMGAVFLVYAAALAYTATRPLINRRVAWGATILNFTWVAVSVTALIFGWLPLTAAGFWVVVAQAVLVDLIACAQLLALRRP